MGVAHKYSFPFCFIICLFSRLTAGSCFPLGRGGFRLTAGICLSLEALKTAKGPQSRAPSAHPLGFFLVVQGIRCSYLLTCVCMLRYSARYAVPMLFYFLTFSVIHFWQGVCILRYSAHYAMPILFYFFHFLSDSLLARCLYSSILSALLYADIISFLHFLRDSLLARSLYSSILSALLYADIISFLHFLYDSLPARCLYSSILSALRAAISRFESQVRGGRLLVVTRCAPCSAAAPVCCHSRKLASLKQCARWQQLSSPR